MPHGFATTRHTLRAAKRRTQDALRDLTLKRATGSRYTTLSRKDRRQVEHWRARVAEEAARQKDLVRGERMNARIGHVVARIRNDLTAIQKHLGSYTFANTVGADSDASGDCARDLSTEGDARAAWKDQLRSLMTLLSHYADAQHLGNYAIGHSVVVDTAACASAPKCCPHVYRAQLYYGTPSGDCLVMPSELGTHSGSTSSSVDTDAFVSADAKSDVAASHGVLVVHNTDFQLRQMRQLFVDKDLDAWRTFLVDSFTALMTVAAYTAAEAQDTAAAVANGVDPVANPELVENTHRVAYLQSAFQTDLCFPAHVVELLFHSVGPTDDLVDYKNTFVVMVDSDMQYLIDRAMTIDNIEDEADFQYIARHVHQLLTTARQSQERNDRERDRAAFFRETSESTQSVYQDQLDEALEVDLTEVAERLRVGRQVEADIEALYAEHCDEATRFFDGC